MASENSEPRYVINIAAKMAGLEVHTLRYYERHGLVQPYRSEGNIRYYSQSDVERLCRVRDLMNDLGVNLAGAEVIIRMAEKMTEMQRQIREMESEIGRLRQAQSEQK